MKTYSKITALLIVVALLVFGAVSCGGGAESLVNGKTFAFDSCTMDGEDATESITSIYKEQTLTFKDDGVCTQTIVWADEVAEMMGSTDPIEQDGTYEEKDGKVTVTIASDEGDVVMEFTVEGDMLTMTEDGSVMVYKAQA